MKTINPYLNFPGNTEEAFNFYKTVFGGEFLALQRFKDTPESSNVPSNEKEKIMHIALPIGRDAVLMGSDSLESMEQKLTIGNNFYLSIEADSKAEAEKVFARLSDGGKATMPLADTFWGAYFGMLIDKYDVRWMVSYNAAQH